METEEIMTAEELAELLQVMPSTIRRWSRQGKIPAIRISPKVVRYDPVAVVAAIFREGEQ